MKRVFFFTELQAKKAVSKPSHAPFTPQYLGLFSLWTNKARGKRLWDVQLENQWNSISPGTPEVNCGGPPSLELYRALETSANDNKYTTLAFTFWRCLHTLLISAYTFYIKAHTQSSSSISTNAPVPIAGVPVSFQSCTQGNLRNSNTPTSDCIPLNIKDSTILHSTPIQNILQKKSFELSKQPTKKFCQLADIH
jgi:hypothetical protein